MSLLKVTGNGLESAGDCVGDPAPQRAVARITTDSVRIARLIPGFTTVALATPSVVAGDLFRSISALNHSVERFAGRGNASVQTSESGGRLRIAKQTLSGVS